ncbi:putative DNA repair and recombination protein RAD26 [Sclerotinia borealis F-4128]|uniref:Putative DNA repair and recombination protein RAD26 n=1 Tax=Sclerotinia borealis (strain F-4128) TaxID=1432307 RepID=W9CXK7_SCLBF|nr:putative DNA repair and recombination protein RAD26 [Sclerotinia borealis F-4128]
MDSSVEPRDAHHHSIHIKSESNSPPPHNVRLHREHTDTIEEAAAVIADEALLSDNDANIKIQLQDEASALAGLTENVRNQDDLERDITNQANLVMIEQEDQRDQKRIEKVKSSIEKLESQKNIQERRLHTLSNNPLMRQRCADEISRIRAEISDFKKDITDIQKRIGERHQYDDNHPEADAVGGSRRMPNESQREFLIRTGKITPFQRTSDAATDLVQSALTDALMDAENKGGVSEPGNAEAEPRSHQNLRLPGFGDVSDNTTNTTEDEFGLRPRKKRRLVNSASTDVSPPARSSSADDDAFTPEHLADEVEELDDENEEDEEDALMTARTSTKKRSKPGSARTDEAQSLAGIDDGNEDMYQARLASWVGKRSAARRQHLEHNPENEEDAAAENSWEKEWFKPCPGQPDHQFENGLKLPGDIFPALFDYQKTGVQWLSELYNQQVGGIIGDEMGLGKTIQIISFLAALHYSKKLTKPIIVVAPATVLRQWVNEFHRWWPALRVSILHSSGSGMLNMKNEGRLEDEEDEILYGQPTKKAPKSQKLAQKIVDRVVKHGHVLVTTYAGLQTYSDTLINVDWDYAVLDEGHKIRNPNTAVTIYCKELRTPNRVILSGTPMQNGLIELWSLFDFVFPMRLGTLVNFRQSFEVPIKIGGYANATNLQVLTATKCAETLKDAISPYLLQRLKVDVAADLPKKSEQVLFCKLTRPQRDAYEMFLSSDDMKSILNHSRQSLYGIDILRKICNHPDLLDKRLKTRPDYKWGNGNKSGKMQVVKALLQMWKGYGHKTLLFSQGVQMLDILEEFVKKLGGFNYLRMDGGTAIKDRQTLVDQFNNDPDIHVFLLTTKVGGLGVNLTGANRVIIFDPDWNPSTDVQARERAWRLGQKKEVTIYRLMTAGTIEEKIYHRQIFKQFLTNKILKDPKQRQTFAMKDLYDLFTLGDQEGGTTETGEMFKGTEVQFSKTSSPSTQGDSESDLRNLAGVAELEQFNDPSEEKEKESNDESRLMEGIFARSGVHSALEHDQIINGKRKIAADRGMIEREAKRIAAESATALRRAGEAARSIAPGTVTWTGEYGSAGRPTNVRRGAGPSSSSVLSSLANRQGLNQPSSSGSSRTATPDRPVGHQRHDFAKMIVEFIKRMGGSVPSQSVVNHFDRYCTSDRVTAQFKHTLTEVAICEQGTNSRMRAKWVLRDEFK